LQPELGQVVYQSLRVKHFGMYCPLSDRITELCERRIEVEAGESVLYIVEQPGVTQQDRGENAGPLGGDFPGLGQRSRGEPNWR
jgi:hypothetical protein